MKAIRRLTAAELKAYEHEIGVDIRAWEREDIHFDRESGEVRFG